MTDNGIGIRNECISDSRSLGLVGMRERAYAFGGDVSISGINGKGTSLIVRMPVQRADGDG